MAIDYKKELEAAAKSMILVHDPDVLIKMIVRLMIQKVKVAHAGILLRDNAKDTFILSISRGITGVKIPEGFIRMDADNPLICFFKQHVDKELFGDNLIEYQQVKITLQRKKLNPERKEMLGHVLNQMDIVGAVVCIPSYFQDELLGILCLGKKRSGRPFKREELDFFVALASDVAMAVRNAQLIEKLNEELAKNKNLFIHTIEAIGKAIEAKDHYTKGHTERVTNLSLEIGKELMQDASLGLSKEFYENLRIAASLHDIGKIGVPEVILNKDGPLTKEEWQEMQRHPALGATILEPITELKEAILGIKYHHERYDGKGYPEGLSSHSIPLIAAVISVSDSFDAMASDRPYRKALSKELAIKEIEKLSGQQFHPLVVAAFLKLYREGNPIFDVG